MRKRRSVYLAIDSLKFYDNLPMDPPVWAVRCPSHNFEGTNHHVRVEFCPHCGQKLPEIEPAPVGKQKICASNDGYYCTTCDERLRACQCLSPAFRWRPKKVKS